MRLPSCRTGSGVHFLLLAPLVIVLVAAAPGLATAQDCVPIDAGLSAGGPIQSMAPDASGGPPAMHSFEIHQDTPSRREDTLRQRPVADGKQAPTEVPPLPGQAISPPSPIAR